MSTTRAFRVGITGKFGSGKSTLAKMFRSAGMNILEADVLAKDAMRDNSELKRKIIDLLSDDAYTSSGDLDTAYIASRIFSKTELRLAVEEAVHPVVLELAETEFAKSKPGEIVGMESALLFQTGLDAMFDVMVFVDADDESVVTRYKGSARFTEDDIRRRLAEQGFEAGMAEDAEFVVRNDSTEEEFVKRAAIVVELVKLSAMQEVGDLPLRSEELS